MIRPVCLGLACGALVLSAGFLESRAQTPPAQIQPDQIQPPQTQSAQALLAQTLTTQAMSAATSSQPQAESPTDFNQTLLKQTYRLPVFPNQFSTASTSALEQAVHAQINEYRTSRSLPPLTLDSRLSAQARAHSQNMASRRVPFSHQGFDQRVRTVGRAIPYRQTAENVAFNRGVADPVRQAVQGWIDSPGHYANLTGSYDLTGVGVSRNSRGEYYFTQMFLRRR